MIEKKNPKPEKLSRNGKKHENTKKIKGLSISKALGSIYSLNWAKPIFHTS
jgi:hypothetical protein